MRLEGSDRQGLTQGERINDLGESWVESAASVVSAQEGDFIEVPPCWITLTAR